MNYNLDLIDKNIINLYNLENELFECPVCEKNFKAIDFNKHYKNCYLSYIKKIQDEVNERNKNIEIENNNNYYKSIFEYLFDKLNNIDCEKVFMNNKLDFIDINFNNSAIIFNNNKKLNKDYENIILINENNNLKGTINTFLLNNNKKYNYENNNHDIIFINSSNLFKKDINKLIINNKNSIKYFTDINLIQFISELLNIDKNSNLIFLLYLIKFSDNKLDVYFNNNLSDSENIYFKHLNRLNYINIINNNKDIIDVCNVIEKELVKENNLEEVVEEKNLKKKKYKKIIINND